jgi:hypothetical protein
MKINVPERRSFPTDPTLPYVQPSLGQTGNAQYGRVFSPIANSLRFYTSGGEYDADSIANAQEYVNSRNDLSDAEQRRILTFGIGSQDNLAHEINFIEAQRNRQDVISRSSGLNIFITHPSLHFSLAIPYLGVSAASRLGTALRNVQGSRAVAGIGPRLTAQAEARFGPDLAQVARFAPERLREIRGIGPARAAAAEEAFVQPVSMAVSARQLMRGTPLTATQLARIGALDAAVIDGSMSLTEALTEIGMGEDPVDELTNAALLTTGTTIFGGALGYGFGAILGRPLGQGARVKAFHDNYRQYLNNVSDRPLDRGEDVSYAGQWFTNSIFYRALPTPLKVEIGDAAIPNWAKEDLLGLGGDSGLPTIQNQRGESHGASVFTNAGRRQGEWYEALEIINQGYREVNPRGATEILNVPVGSYIERVRRAIGRESFSPEDWYNHIGRLYLDEIPYDRMTGQEAAAVQAFESFIVRYGDGLSDIGLINRRDLLEETYVADVGRQSELVSVVNGIIEQNRTWMTKGINEISQQIEQKSNILRGLSREETGRGLTAAQLKLRKKLDEEIVDLQASLQRFDQFFEKINAATSVDELAALYNQLDLTPSMQNALKNLGDAMSQTRRRVENAARVLERRDARPETRHFPTFYNRPAIEQNREKFKGILIRHFRENPEVITKTDEGLYEFKKLSTAPDDLAKRADDTIDRILGEVDDDAVDAMFSGTGRSGPLMSRRLDIPRNLIKDFIVTDVKDVMIAYTQRVAPRLEFHKRFPHPETGKLMSLESRLQYMRNRLTQDGVPEDKINRYIKNFVGTYDRIVGGAIKNPDAIDTRIAETLRSAATWTYLGGSSVAALGDIASLFMDHELRVLGNTLLSLTDDVTIGMGKKELNLAGEALELSQGMTHIRYVESLSSNSLRRSVFDKVNNGFFTANLLGPVTVMIKSMDSLLRGHTIIEASQKLLDGRATEFERTFLARYNITEDLARRITSMPFEQSRNGLFLPNTKAWTDEEAVNAFRNALRSGVMNRVIMGTPADKPLVMDGVAYIPERVASKLPYGSQLPVDPRVPGYRRIESGLLALPFTFYSYTLGALNKITANHAAGAVRNRLTHAAVALGLGSMIVQFRTPNYIWENMDTDDKIARAFDFSGLAAIYSDMGYRTLAMANELGFESNFPIQPKFNADPDPLGALLSLGGAPVDWTYNLATSVGDLLQGNYNDGVKGLIRSMPLIDAIGIAGGLRDDALSIANQLPNSR